MARPDFRIACCLCKKPIPRSSDIYALDEEWQRRFPTMVGFLACRCAVSVSWSCRTADGAYVTGHRRASRKDECYDSWDHIGGWGTHVAMVLNDPYSGLLQGAEDYLRYTVQRARTDPNTVRAIQDALDRFDGHPANNGIQAGESTSAGAAVGDHPSSSRPADGGCPACERYVEHALPNYHHVHDVDALPRERHTDSHRIVHGYAVHLGGRIDPCWVFFADLEPALAFGRAGRMSSVDISSYGVMAAARELRYDHSRGGDVHTLYVAENNLDRGPDEHQALQRWLAGVNPNSSHFRPT